MSRTRLLDVRPGEGRRVGGMFALLGLIIATSYILKPVRSALFLDQFGAERLPYVYLAVAIVLGLVASGYSMLSQRADLPRLFTWTSVVFACALVGFWLLTVSGWRFTGFAFYVWVSLFTALMPSLFWLLANYIFYSNEGRRLFPVVMAGGLLGSVLGGAATSLLVPVLGTSGLLLVAAALLLAVVILVRWNASIESARMAERRADLSRRERERAGDAERSPLRMVGRSRYLSMLAAFIALGSLVSTLVDYQFSAVVERSYESRDAMTGFFGVFFATINVIAFVLQLLVTGRLLSRFGVGVGLVMLPLALLSSSVAFLLVPALVTAMAIKASDDGLSNSVHRASVEVLYLPLSLAVKNRLKAWLDMFVERASRGLAGIAILSASALSLSVSQLSLVVVVLLAPWILLALALKREYLATFRSSIARRDITDFTSELRDPASVSVFRNVLEAEDERETLYALALLSGTDDPGILDIVVSLADHESPAIRTAALRVLRSATSPPALEDFPKRVVDPDPTAGAEALVLWRRLEPERAEMALERIIHDEHAERLRAVLDCLQESGELVSEELATRVVEENREAEAPERRELAARAVGFLPPSANVLTSALALIEDADLDVARAAVASAGRLGGARALPALVDLLRRRPLRAATRKAIARFGPEALDELERRLADASTALDVRLAVPSVVAEIKDSRSVSILVGFLPQEDHRLHYQAIKSLSRLRASGRSLRFPKAAIERLLEGERARLLELARLLSSIVRTSSPAESHRLLALVLEERLEFTRERIYRLLGLVYAQDEILSVWSRVTTGRPAVRAQALEFLSSSLSAEHRERLFPLLEPAAWAEVESAGQTLTSVAAPKFDVALRQLASSPDVWLAACAVTVIGDVPVPSLLSTIAPLREHVETVVREAAARAYSRMEEGRVVPS